EGSSEDLVPACLCPIRELLISDLLHALTRDTDMSVCDHQYCSRPGIDVKRHEARGPRKSLRAGDRGQAPPTPGTGGVVPGALKPGACSDPAGERACSAMDYARLGHSGLKVSRLCLGTMTLGRWGNDDPADCARIIRRALDEGVTFIDTANRYGMGESEEIVGMALEGRRAEAVVATKVFMPGPGGMLDRGTSRRHIFLQVEESLRRLRTDWIDLYQIHRNDKETPLEEALGALTDLVRQGKVRYLGVSTGTLAESGSMHFGGWKMVESLWLSERRNLER